MESKVILEWAYTPKDYFEEPYHSDEGGYELKIVGGHVTATLAVQIYDEKNREVEAKIYNRVRNLFLGIQIVSHKPFNLPDHPAVRRQCPDGSATISVRSIISSVTVTGDVDTKVMDAEGNVIADTKAERIQKKIKFAELAAKYGQIDPTVKATLRSYERSVNDPDNELVHLFEIWEALNKRFGGNENSTLKALNISHNERSAFGTIVNDPSIRQGRHSGKYSGGLRDARNEELDKVRSIARIMIENYFAHLESANNTSSV